MTFFNAFSAIGRNIWQGAKQIAKPVLQGVLAVTPHVIQVGQSLSMIPVIGAAASQVAAAANIVQNVAVTTCDIIQIG